MVPARRFVVFSVILILTVFQAGHGQVIDPTTAAQEPVAGAGHDYIGVGTETVNPADGSVTFDLPIRTPPGRELSFPFGIHFNSSEPFYLQPGGNLLLFDWQTPTGSANAPPFSLNGWSYDLPSYAAQGFVASTHASTSGPGQYNYCWAGQNYRFNGFDHSHALYAGYSWPDPNNPQPQLNSTNCPQASTSGLGDDGVSWSLGTVSSNVSTGTQPALTVTDKSGTVYQFPQGPVITTSPTAGIPAPFGALAQTITDRNGNQIVLTGTSTTAAGGLQAGYYTDTAGRKIVSWTGIGSSGGDQLTISGLGTVTVKWTTTTVTFPDAPTDSHFIWGNNSSISSSNCTFSGSESITMAVVSEIDLPNNQKYTFTYGGQWGRLSQITFPGGGYVAYTWGTAPETTASYQQSSYGGCWVIADTAAITDRYLSYDGSSVVMHQHFTYDAPNWSEPTGTNPSWTTKETIVTNTDSVSGLTSTTEYFYAPIVPIGGPTTSSWQSPAYVPVEQTVIYKTGSGSTLRTDNKTWMDQYAMVGDQTILDNNQGITTLRCYDYYDRLLGAYEYGLQSTGSKTADPPCSYDAQNQTTLSGGLNTSAMGPLIRQTVVAYHSFANTYILNEPDTVTISDGSGNMVRQTTYQYDQSAVIISGAKTGLVSPPGLRGNVTSVLDWLNTGGSSPTTTYAYYDTGQVQTMIAPCGNTVCSDITSPNGSTYTTIYSYADQFASGTGTPPGATDAYLTQVTYPNTGVVHQESFSWGYENGLLMSRTDQNNGQWTYQYSDPLLRLTSIQGPPDPQNNNQQPLTTYLYTDWQSGDSLPASSSINSSELMNTSGETLTNTTVLDGMGQTTRSETTSDPLGTDYIDTVYDGSGHVYSVTTPYRSTSDPTYEVITSLYDPLGRKTSEADAYGTKQWFYSGTTVTYEDENGNEWQRTSDSLGRLIQVLEPNGQSQTPSMETDYTYDDNNNLLTVAQWGVANGNSGERARTFTYDSLSRLLYATNPETGTISYAYDADGNVTSKTDAMPVVINYQYDTLNRLIAKSYISGNDGQMPDASKTPWSCYQYDVSSLSGAGSNLIGRLTNEWTLPAGTGCTEAPPSAGLLTLRAILSYDPAGRVTSEQQCSPAGCATGSNYALSYKYDLAGDLTSSNNGITATPGASTPVVFTSNYDGAGRLQSLTSTWAQNTLIPSGDSGVYPTCVFGAQISASPGCSQTESSTAPPYAAFGGLTNAAYGNGLNLSRTFDKRLRLYTESDSSNATPATPGSATITISGAEQSQ